MSEDLEPVEKVKNPCQTFYLHNSSGEVNRYYLKSEADKVIARHKYKRCVAMAVICFNRAERANCWKEEVKSRKRSEKWLELAEKFKEAK